MKHTNFICTVLLSYLMLSLLGCECNKNPTQISNTAENTIAVQTYTSSKQPVSMQVKSPPQRVITNQEGTLTTVLAFQEGPSVIGASISNRYMYPITEDILCGQQIPPIIRHEFSSEEVLMNQPDLIIGWRSTFSFGALKDTSFWNQRGIATYIVASSNLVKKNATIDDECRFILDMGRIYGKEDVAKQIVLKVRKKLALYQSIATRKESPKVMVLQYNTPSNIFSYENSWLIGDIVRQLGGELLSGNVHTLAKEELIQKNPDVIFVLCTGDDDRKQYEDYVRNDIALNSINAVKNNRIYGIPFSFVYAPGIRILNGIEVVFNGMYN